MKETSNQPTPVLIITDIGADIDDALALLALLGASPVVQVVAVVTCVGNGMDRAVLANGWISLFNRLKTTIPIWPSIDNSNPDAGIHIPVEFRNCELKLVGKPEDTAASIVEIAEKYSGDLVALCIAPLTPLAAAMDMDKKGVLRNLRRVYVQGNVAADDRGHLTPLKLAYNFRLDIPAAEKVFSLQKHVPFSVLGKFAAYQVSLTRSDFEGFGRADVPSLLDAALAQLVAFKQKNPELFKRVYHLSDEDMETSTWLEKLQVLSHPYDALLALQLLQNATQSPGCPIERLFDEVKVNGRHVLIGNTNEENGVHDPGSVKNELVKAICKGLSAIAPNADCVT